MGKVIEMEWDFLGEGAVPLVTDESGGPWVRKTVQTGGAPSCNYAAIAGGIGGVQLALDSTSEAQEVNLYWGDKLQIDVDQLLYFEWVFQVSTLFTGVAEARIGLAGAYNATPDSVAQNLWFMINSDETVEVESDDGTTDTDDVATGKTIAVSTIYRVGFSFSEVGKSNIFAFWNQQDVRGERVGSSGTLSLNAYTGGLQPYVHLLKASGTGVGTIDILRARMRGRVNY